MLTTLDTHTALVLIDLQKGIVAGEKAHSVETVLGNAARLMVAFRQAQLPIVIVHVEPIGAPASVVRSEKNQFPKDRDGQQRALGTMSKAGFFNIVEAIQPEPGDILITKETWNAFFNRPLHEALQQRNVTGIVLAGISTSIGVEGTARSANEYGYNITFAIDAMTDTIAEAHDVSLTYIFPRIGELATTDEIIQKLRGREQNADLQ
jgi:nicotinamidase-related amidase